MADSGADNEAIRRKARQRSDNNSGSSSGTSTDQQDTSTRGTKGVGDAVNDDTPGSGEIGDQNDPKDPTPSQHSEQRVSQTISTDFEGQFGKYSLEERLQAQLKNGTASTIAYEAELWMKDPSGNKVRFKLGTEQFSGEFSYDKDKKKFKVGDGRVFTGTSKYEDTHRRYMTLAAKKSAEAEENFKTDKPKRSDDDGQGDDTGGSRQDDSGDTGDGNKSIPGWLRDALVEKASGMSTPFPGIRNLEDSKAPREMEQEPLRRADFQSMQTSIAQYKHIWMPAMLGAGVLAYLWRTGALAIILGFETPEGLYKRSHPELYPDQSPAAGYQYVEGQGGEEVEEPQGNQQSTQQSSQQNMQKDQSFQAGNMESRFRPQNITPPPEPPRPTGRKQNRRTVQLDENN